MRTTIWFVHSKKRLAVHPYGVYSESLVVASWFSNVLSEERAKPVVLFALKIKNVNFAKK